MALGVADPQLRPENLYRPDCWAQARALVSTAPELLYSGGIGTGKTRCVLEKADVRCRRYAGARVAVTRLHRQHIGQSILPELKKVIAPSHWEAGYSPAADGGSTLKYPNGSVLVLLGLDWPQRLQSTEWDMIVIEQAEEVEEEHWDFCQGRLRHKTYRVDDEGFATDELAPLQLVAPCNPGSPQHFLFKRFRPDRGSHRVWSVDSIEMPDGRIIPPGDFVREVVVATPRDNLSNLPEWYVRRLMRMHGRYYERMVLGHWVAFEGMVFDVWREDQHVISRPKAWDEWGGYPPPSWDRIRCIDFGYNPDPFVCKWWARMPSGRAIMYREIYKMRRIVSEHARVILREEEKELAALRSASRRNGMEEPPYLKVVASYGDHDAEDRATLEQEGVVVDRAVKDRSPGIQTLYELLTPDEQGIPGLRYVRPEQSLVEGRDPNLEDRGMPTCTIEEYGQLRWDQKGCEGRTEGADHGIDADRYAWHTLRDHSPEYVFLH